MEDILYKYVYSKWLKRGIWNKYQELHTHVPSALYDVDPQEISMTDSLFTIVSLDQGSRNAAQMAGKYFNIAHDQIIILDHDQ